jgi:NAD(P)-dependent dehydrogenase (short-subunit alcohol dehydrogenase family)
MTLTDSPRRVALVTGGAQGIGAGCVRAFVQAGWRVVIADVNQPAGETLAAGLNALGPGECLFAHCDVRDAARLQAVIDEAALRYGRLDCLVNNAGWHPPHRPIDDFSLAEFQDLLQLNLVAVFAGCKFALPHLRRVRGSIVNLSSLVAVIGQEQAVTYCATKGGVSALTKGLAIDEARHGVRVNAILPGNIVTPMRVQSVAQAPDPAALDAWIESTQPFGRSGTVDEVGQACLFLAGESASFITGIELILSGGAELGYGVKAPPPAGDPAPVPPGAGRP